MLRFKQYLNERRAKADFGDNDATDFGRDNRADFGSGSQADFGGPSKSVTTPAYQKAMTKGPSTSPSSIQNPEQNPDESMKNLDIPKVQAPSMPAPFSKGKPNMKNFDEYMKTRKAPSPNLHTNPSTGGPIEIPGQHIHVHVPTTGPMDSSIPSSDSHIHVHVPQTGSIPQDQAPTSAPTPEPRMAPIPQPQQAPQGAPKPQTQAKPDEQLKFAGEKARKAAAQADAFAKSPEEELKRILGKNYVAP